jgi:hypothetical protein
MKFKKELKSFEKLIETYVNDLAEKNIEIIFQPCPDRDKLVSTDWTKLPLIVQLMDNKNDIDYLRLDPYKYVKFDKAQNYWTIWEELLFALDSEKNEDKRLQDVFDTEEINALGLQLNGSKLSDVLKFYLIRTRLLQYDLHENDFCLGFQGSELNEDDELEIKVKVFLRTISDKRQLVRLDMEYSFEENRDIVLQKSPEYYLNITDHHPQFKFENLLLGNI